MLYKDLDRNWKLSISGSINNKLKDISSVVEFDDIFQHWYEEKFEEVEGKIQFVKIITDERLDIDDELMQDIKKVFKERLDKRKEKVKIQEEARTQRQKEEKATDKQLKYARKLYEQVQGDGKDSCNIPQQDNI